MELGYNILFTIQIKLDASFSNDFYIVPVPSAVSKLNQHEMIFKKNSDGCLVAAGYLLNDSGIAKNIRPFCSVEKFTFLLILNNSQFYSYANLQNYPDDNNRIGRRFYYFSNLDNVNAIDGKVTNGQALLSQNETVSASDMWSIIPPNYQFYVDKTKYNEVELYKMNPSEPDEKLPSIFSANMPNASFSLQNYTPGAFQLKWKGVETRVENIYADDQIIRSNLFGLIEIYKNQNANSAVLTGQPVNYIIPFKKVA